MTLICDAIMGNDNITNLKFLTLSYEPGEELEARPVGRAPKCQQILRLAQKRLNCFEVGISVERENETLLNLLIQNAHTQIFYLHTIISNSFSRMNRVSTLRMVDSLIDSRNTITHVIWACTFEPDGLRALAERLPECRSLKGVGFRGTFQPSVVDLEFLFSQLAHCQLD